MQNADLLAPGRSYEVVARRAWDVPAVHRPFGYYCLAHGIGKDQYLITGHGAERLTAFPFEPALAG